MNSKNCKHYNEVVRVLDNNLSLEDVNFEIDDTDGCKCKSDEDSVCDLWVALALAHDFTPAIGIQTAEKTLADLDAKITEIAWGLLPKVNEPKSIDEQVSIDEPYVDAQLYESLSPEKKDLIEQLVEMNNTTIKNEGTPLKKIYRGLTNKQNIETAISNMDTEKLQQLLSDKYLYSEWDKENFIGTLEVATFSAFRANGDTFLKPYHGSCNGGCGNKGCSGIAFVGNKSKDVVNIIFKENELEVTDLFSCGSFKTFEKVTTNYIQSIPLESDINSEFPF